MARSISLALLVLVPSAASAYAVGAGAARPRPVQAARLSVMLARKPFKGGNLDDFLSAGAAEAKYGPQRYAAVSADNWRIEVEAQRSDAEKQRAQRVYDSLKQQMLSDHAFLSALGVAAVWMVADVKGAFSYAVGAALGALYLVLLQRQTTYGFAAESVEQKAKAGPPPIIVPVLMVLMVAKNPAALSLIPTLVGFATKELATLAQAIYPNDFGLDASD